MNIIKELKMVISPMIKLLGKFSQFQIWGLIKKNDEEEERLTEDLGCSTFSCYSMKFNWNQILP